MIKKYHAAAGKTRLCDAEWLNWVSPKIITMPQLRLCHSMISAITRDR